ncbi:hypothetical protein FRC07_011545, partial [Ceratobasidium sp. 392]
MSEDDAVVVGSPAGSDTEIKKKKKARRRRKNRLDDAYVPTIDVQNLPRELQEDQKLWWSRYVGKLFADAVATRGLSNNNGTEFIRKKFYDEFLPQHHSDVSFRQPDAEWYYDLMHAQLYTFVYNNTFRKGKWAPKPPKVDLPKKYAYAHDAWRHANEDIYDPVLNVEVAKAGRFLGIHERMAISRDMFAKLPESEQAHWAKVAQDNQAFQHTLVRVTNKDERDRYAAKVVKTLNNTIREAEAKAGIKILAQILAPQGENNFKISSVHAPGLANFASAGPLDDFLNGFTDWVKVNGGNDVEGDPPRLTAIPDYSKDKRPMVPPYNSAQLAALRKLFRMYMTLLWIFQGGCPKVPWDHIAQDIDKWIDPARRPLGAVWKDPGSIQIADILAWLQWIVAGQNGELSPEQILQFRRVVPGPAILGESESQATDRKSAVSRKTGRTTVNLIFDDLVTKCQVPGGMDYPKECLEYAHYLAVRMAKARAPAATPERWLGLPTATPHQPRTVFDGDEKAAILDAAVRLHSSIQKRVETCVDVLNAHESHIPAS